MEDHARKTELSLKGLGCGENLFGVVWTELDVE